MPELTEKVARAIYGARIKGLDIYPCDSDLFEKAIDAAWRLCEGEARAAIAASEEGRSPTLAPGWAVQCPDGRLIVNAEASATEATTWWMACGYADDVARAKARGARAFRCEIREIEE
jgi:hypothetical protein